MLNGRIHRPMKAGIPIIVMILAAFLACAPMLSACSGNGNGGRASQGVATTSAAEDASASESASEQAEEAAESSAEDEARDAAVRAKLAELVDAWGYPEVVRGAGDYISGLAFARIVDFGDGEDRLVVSYYDPSGDSSADEPGGSPESYPVEVWEYDGAAGGLNLAHSGYSQLEGQNSYCSCIMFANTAEGGVSLYEREGTWGGPDASYAETLYSAVGDGTFGPVAQLYTESSFVNGEYATSYRIDGGDAPEEQAEAFKAYWLADFERIYLNSPSGSDRDLQPAIDQTMATLAALEVAPGSD